MGCNDCVLFIILNIIGESEAIEGTVNAEHLHEQPMIFIPSRLRMLVI